MHKITTFLFSIIISCYTVIGQSPDRINYQAILRDGGNTILTNRTVFVKFTIQQGSIGGAFVYDEIFQTTTNSYGLVNLEIGSGTTNNNFSTINWRNGPYFLETAIDLSSNNQWTIMGTSQLLSVPYAFHSNTTDSLIGGITGLESDPHFLSSIASGITASDTALWNNYTDTDTQLDSIDITNFGFVAGPHPIDTDTQLDSIDITNFGFVAGPHPIDTDTQLDSIDITNFGFVAEKTYTIGMNLELGGYVFKISADGKHGLVAEIQDQSTSTVKWYGCDDFISNPNNHSLVGQNFFDWRLPSKNELNQMYVHRVAIGGNFNLAYWSSSQESNLTAWTQNFSSGVQSATNKNNITQYVRGVREF